MRYQPLCRSLLLPRSSLELVPCGGHSDQGVRFITTGRLQKVDGEHDQPTGILPSSRPCPRITIRRERGERCSSKGGEPLLGQVPVLGVDLDQVRPAAQLDGCDTGRPAASERIGHESPGSVRFCTSHLMQPRDF